ncbi:hypothetical protein GRX66_16685, partial [Halobacterium sp. PCN9]|nr:hypothetical protein [Halobacterium bonnevillei]
MTLDRLRPLATRLMAPWVRGAVAVGATPNVISIVAFVFAIGAAVAFYVATPLAYAVGAAVRRRERAGWTS